MYNLDDLLRGPGVADELHRQIHENAEPTYLRSVKVKIISNCNLRCEMCKYWRIAKQKIEIDVIKRVLDDAVVLGSKKVHFSGGEVTLHPDLEEAIHHAADLGMRVNLTSNGILMDKPRAKRWIAAGLRSASFSLDGIDSKTH
ncbi:MAG: radical SAM protein, partial [Planctomycetaceae bacterium]